MLKVAALEGPLLDLWVARAEGQQIRLDPMGFGSDSTEGGYWVWNDATGSKGFMKIGSSYSPSANWAQGGPLFERESISWNGRDYAVHPNFKPSHSGGGYHPIGMRGPTLLIAAMRCYVAAKFGVTVPEESDLMRAEEDAPQPEGKKQ